jgi:sugar-specific transcriptional regulator TrmB
MEVLQELGFSQKEAEVYIFISKEGLKKSGELAVGLMMTKRQLSPVLKSLELKGAIVSNSSHSRSFTALSFGKVLKDNVRKKAEIASTILKDKKELIDSWTKLLEDKSYET